MLLLLAVLLGVGLLLAARRRRALLHPAASAAPPRFPSCPPDHPAARHFAAEYEESAPRAPGAFDEFGGTVECTGCATQFPAGTPFCGHCGAPTADAPDSREEVPTGTAGRRGGDEADELVCVHVAPSPTQAVVLKGYLESHDIACLASGQVPSSLYHFTVSPLAEVRLLVRAGDAERARALLDECL
ncbi:MAG: DUF2007 domain-containing protein [Candidatus Sumerlaeia bacterium]|nr:DUF2007 domain-containing protein [Candidatus Sumerlaeia bacterium]